MMTIDKSKLTEADIIAKFILPAIKASAWDDIRQIRHEVKLRDGKVVVRGQLASRKTVKSADIVLYHKPNQPLAVVEAKANRHGVGKGMQQALDYARLLNVPFAFASNGDGFIFHDKSSGAPVETELALEDFPTPAQLWQKYCQWKNYTPEQLRIIDQDYHHGDGEKTPRYYQLRAINESIEAIAGGQNRVLLVMATGTGKTFTAFQIIWRLWKSGSKKRILFLADRNILVDQTRTNDFRPFGNAMTKIQNRTVDPAYEIHLGLYQALTGPEDKQKAFKQVKPDFFDLIIIDECHRGSAAEDSAWREILEYFSSATQLGMTATPKETETVSNSDYFGDAIYTYSLKEGIEDGFLAPYKVVRVDIDIDLQGWRPEKDQLDKHGELIDDRIYNQKDFDRTMVIDERTELVAQTITSFLKQPDPMAKTIVFCNDIDHADRMRRALINCNPEQAKKSDKYVMKITGDDDLGKAQLDNFINPKKAYPVIATTSELMSTGVDAQTCKFIVLDQNIKSMTKFKQIIGRGTRINEKYNKMWFTIIDFKKATELFADERFDGTPERIMAVTASDIIDNDDVLEDIINSASEENLEAIETDGESLTAEESAYLAGDDTDGPIDLEAIAQRAKKYYVNGVKVTKLAQRVLYYDTDGKLVTESFKDYTRKTFTTQYASLDAFIKDWNASDRKQTIIDELAAAGILWEALVEDVGKDMDPFDLICHVVYGQPALTRSERAKQVQKRDYFSKYSEAAQEVLAILLDKYADGGVAELENLDVFKVQPFDKMGRPMEIVEKAFGSKREYLQIVRKLKDEIYYLPPKLA